MVMQSVEYWNSPEGLAASAKWEARRNEYTKDPVGYDADFVSQLEAAAAKLEEAKSLFDGLKDHPSQHAMFQDIPDIAQKLGEVISSDEGEAGLKPWLEKLKVKQEQDKNTFGKDPHTEALRRFAATKRPGAAARERLRQRAMQRGKRGGLFYEAEGGARVYSKEGR